MDPVIVRGTGDGRRRTGGPVAGTAAGGGLVDALDGEAWRRRLAGPPLSWSVDIPAPEQDFRGGLSEHRVDDLVLTRWTATPMVAARAGSRLAADGEVIVLEILEAGALTLRQDRHDRGLRPGTAIAWRGDRPVRLEVLEPVSATRLVIPRPVLEDVGCHLHPGEPVGDLPAVGILRGYLALLEPTLPGLAGPQAVAARNALLELVWGALQPRTPLDPLALQHARRAAVEHFLDTRLHRADLTLEDVAAAHHVSPRTLHRLFHRTGDTFSRVLAAKRLARVREDLLTGTSSIAALARHWGYVDASHLHRRFRDAYGMSPTEYRRQEHPGRR